MRLAEGLWITPTVPLTFVPKLNCITPTTAKALPVASLAVLLAIAVELTLMIDLGARQRNEAKTSRASEPSGDGKKQEGRGHRGDRGRSQDLSKLEPGEHQTVELRARDHCDGVHCEGPAEDMRTHAEGIHVDEWTGCDEGEKHTKTEPAPDIWMRSARFLSIQA